MTDKLTVAQAASLLHISEREVRRIAKAAILRSTREEGANGVMEYRFAPADVAAYKPAPRGRRWPEKENQP